MIIQIGTLKFRLQINSDDAMRTTQICQFLVVD